MGGLNFQAYSTIFKDYNSRREVRLLWANVGSLKQDTRCYYYVSIGEYFDYTGETTVVHSVYNVE